MEIREFALTILKSDRLEEKLRAVAEPWTDDRPGDPVRIEEPARPANLRITDRRRAARMPHEDGLVEPRLRATAHHVMANHELQALEAMAWTILAFPSAPLEFRSGLATIMCEEQRHTRMHVGRLERLGMRFGDRPVNGHVWRSVIRANSLLEYLACLPLTFEGGNLDHSLEYARRFERAGDTASAQLMRGIHGDEIGHVAFGIEWLRQFKPAGSSDWNAYRAALIEPMKARHSRGIRMDLQSRHAAGLTEEFIDRLAQEEVLPSPHGELGS